MPQSLAKNYVHLIFSTKYRAGIIPADLLTALHAYIGGTMKGLHCPVIVVGGMPDHVHVLFMLDKNSSLSGVVERMKRATSKWMKEQSPECREFAWQDGYAAFSVSQLNLETVKHYIQDQEEHHKGKNYVEELKWFLNAYQVSYDERYL